MTRACWRCGAEIPGLGLAMFHHRPGPVDPWIPVDNVVLCLECGGNGQNVASEFEETMLAAGADETLDRTDHPAEPPAAAQADSWPVSGPTGEDLKAAGTDLAADAAQPWMEQARAVLDRLAATGHPFTSEDIVDRVGLPHGQVGTNRNNAVGALFAHASKARLIRRVGERKATRPELHAAVVTIWRGNNAVGVLPGDTPVPESRADAARVRALRLLDHGDRANVTDLLDRLHRILSEPDQPPIAPEET